MTRATSSSSPSAYPLFLAAIGTGKRVLDLGCRSGALTRHFLEGNEVVGLDVDRAALAKAEALGIEPVEANVEEALPFADASFDAVVAGELLEHLQFPEALVAEARRVLRQRGVLVGSGVPFRLQSQLRFLAAATPRTTDDARTSSPAAVRELLHGEGRDARLRRRALRLHARRRRADLVFPRRAAGRLLLARRGRRRLARCRRRPPCGRPGRRSRPCRRSRAGRDRPRRSRSTPSAASSTRRA